MSPTLIIAIVVSYFLLLVGISLVTGKSTDNNTFFKADKNSPWYVVAFGMIGASLSGVTFLSVPGWVGTSSFSYMQMVMGYMLGYFVIIRFLLPLYYRMNLTSIYEYLEDRFGFWAYKTGASYFLVSRIIGSSFRLYLVAGAFQIAIFDYFGVPFYVSTLITIGLIWLYTFRSGMKTIVWTDTFQTFFMLAAVVTTIILIKDELNWSYTQLITTVHDSDYSRMFFFDDWNDGKHFVKQFLSGAFIAIVMTGLDQDMMQKNLTCRNLEDAQKNMWGLSISLLLVNVLFLTLGAMLYLYTAQHGITPPEKADHLFQHLALHHLPTAVAILFTLGLVAAAYSSADSALAALTTSFCVDFLGFSKKSNGGDTTTRTIVHLGFSFVLFLVIIVFHAFDDGSVIGSLFKAAGYTYGPLLGMFAFGIFTSYRLKDHIGIAAVCVASPVISYVLNMNSAEWFGGYVFGFEILMVNGLLTFIGLWLLALTTTAPDSDPTPQS